MILRRLSTSIRKQDWFAVVIETLIVVMGVGLAMWGQQWLSDRQSRADYERAVENLREDVVALHFAAKERLAVRTCRQARYVEVGELLMKMDEPWPGVAKDFGDEAAFGSGLPSAFQSPLRPWSSQVWNTGVERGSFDQMDADLRQALGFIFYSAQMAETLQQQVYDLESGLQTLAHPLDMTASDRMRYYDRLAQADAAQIILEVLSMQVSQAIDYADGDLQLGEAYNAPTTASLAADMDRLTDVHGDCVEPLEFDYTGDAAGGTE